MSRYIYEDALKEVIQRMWENRKITNTKYNTFLEILDYVPTAEVVEVKHGKWIAYQDGKYHCSRCDDVAPKGYRWNYCPNCGADMRGEK